MWCDSLTFKGIWCKLIRRYYRETQTSKPRRKIKTSHICKVQPGEKQRQKTALGFQQSADETQETRQTSLWKVHDPKKRFETNMKNILEFKVKDDSKVYTSLRNRGKTFV